MEKVISTERLPIKMWLDTIEEKTMDQARNLANLPFAFSHICLMPDTHHGYGMPIGGVLATRGVIIPHAVGVDIGCGMCTVKTNIQTDALSAGQIKGFMKSMREAIPLGFSHHKTAQDESRMPEGFDLEMLPVVRKQYKSALKQLGSLGGGNHFIELQKDETGMLWIMIHSGSRNIGLQVAEHYNKIARQQNALWYSGVEPKWDLAFLPFETETARLYYQEMQYCLAFAFANRLLMMERIQDILSTALPNIAYEPTINIAHNYAAWEEHFGEKVIVHRKGATAAFAGQIGIIPGSQGTKSYIVEGVGNPDSFMSCSHGAGRLLSRTRAVKELDLAEEKRRLDEQGIIHSIRGKSDLEEAASAYKDITRVMELQNDLVRIKTELSPLAVIKG